MTCHILNASFLRTRGSGAGSRVQLAIVGIQRYSCLHIVKKAATAPIYRYSVFNTMYLSVGLVHLNRLPNACTNSL